MSIENAKERFSGLVKTVGKHTLNSLFPNDFEAYITVLELVDSSDRIIEFFLFPLNPESISISTPQISNIRKTAAGINIVSTETYMPSMININGNFGRKFKLLIGTQIIDFEGFNFSETFRQNKIDGVFSNTIKTGYGCIKILKRIIDKSRTLDRSGNPYFLHLYLLAFGESYLVKAINAPTFDMNMNKNMVWSYNVDFETLADLSQLENNDEFSNMKMLGFSELQKDMNRVLAGTAAATDPNNIKKVGNFLKKTNNSIIKGMKDLVNIIE